MSEEVFKLKFVSKGPPLSSVFYVYASVEKAEAGVLKEIKKECVCTNNQQNQ